MQARDLLERFGKHQFAMPCRGHGRDRTRRSLSRLQEPSRPCGDRSAPIILNHMVRYSGPVLDRTFSALADAHRRQILDQLEHGQLSISELAAPLNMSLPGVLKHVRVLEEAHLVVTR
jgi:hypothetical protein